MRAPFGIRARERGKEALVGKLSWFFAAAALIAISCGGKSDTEVGSTGVAQQAQEQAPVLDTFVASKDSWVSRAKPNQNHGADASIEVGGSHRRNGLAAFELSSVPINVTRATLVLSLREEGTASGNSQACQATFVAQTVGQDWTEGNGQTGPGVTWSCATDQNIGNNQRECENSWGGGTPLGPSRAGQPGQ